MVVNLASQRIEKHVENWSSTIPDMSVRVFPEKIGNWVTELSQGIALNVAAPSTVGPEENKMLKEEVHKCACSALQELVSLLWILDFFIF